MKLFNITIFFCLLFNLYCKPNSQMKKKENSNENNEQTFQNTKFGYCYVKFNDSIFDLNKIDVKHEWDLLDNKGQKINFKLCSNIDTRCKNQSVLIAESENCLRFSEHQFKEKKFSHTQDKNKNNVLHITFPTGETCGSNQVFQTIVVITCDKNMVKPAITNNKDFDKTRCNNTIKILSKEVCNPEKFNAWWNQLIIKKKATAAILIIIGLWLMIFGIKFWKINSIMINCVILGLIINSFFLTDIHHIFGMLLGIGIAFIASYYEALNGVILGVGVGFTVGVLIFDFILLLQLYYQNSYIITVFTCILVFTIAGAFQKDHLICLATSLIGSYSFVRGISIYVGNFPEENWVSKLLNKKEYFQFKFFFGIEMYCYLAAILFCTIISFIFQKIMFEPEKLLEIKGNNLTENINEKKEKNEAEDNKTTSAAEQKTETLIQPQPEEHIKN